MSEILPLSRPIQASDVPVEGMAVVIDAAPAELDAVAGLLRVLELRRLHAELAVRPVSGSGLVVEGVVEAEVTQICVVTLEPFQSSVREDVEARFAPPRDTGPEPRRKDDRGSGEPRQADLDMPEPLEDGRADLGALATQFLALGLDPYPRKPGVRFEDYSEGGADAGARPFAALQALKRDIPASED